MKRAVLAAAVVLIALPLAAQTSPLSNQMSQFGILFGGSKRMNDAQNGPSVKDFSFGNSVKEIYFGTRLEPDTMFKIKAGEINLPVLVTDATTGNVTKETGKIDHIDAIVDYRFSESFGTTGVFGGVGMYRSTAPGIADDTNAGLSFGINADLPLSTRYGIVVEGTYHYVHLQPRQRFLTATAGLRIAF
ncbi:MAG TPA: hypothetical protein VGR95_18940 [Thermoanaerobaculia bacterium]|jgi:hypothetical protein|nr:hypothetical protein [Thermoanaerobaculia bacterium]